MIFEDSKCTDYDINYNNTFIYCKKLDQKMASYSAVDICWTITSAPGKHSTFLPISLNFQFEISGTVNPKPLANVVGEGK